MDETTLLKEPAEVKFQNFHRKNPHVYDMYKKFAFQLINKGHFKIGTNMIIERIRWEAKLVTSDKVYKMNNNYAPHYARLFCREFPDHRHRFEMRTLNSW